MKILVTGATGFIGSSLIRKLKSDYEVYAIARLSSNKDFLIKNEIQYYVDNGKTEELLGFLNKEKFDGIVHLASLFLNQHSLKDIEALVDSNILFSTRLLQTAVTSGVKWFINTSTFWQHYQNKNFSPVNLYAATKQAFEDIARYYMETTNIGFVTIALNDTYGPGDTRPKLFTLWKDIAESGRALDMSPGEQEIDISYIDDVVDAYVKLISLLKFSELSEYKGKTYAVSSGERMSLRDIAKVFEKVSGKKININGGGKEYRKREVMKPWDLGEPVPGWKQKVTLEEGILKFLNAENKKGS